jgi:predicted MFS family arabinose efflux permease
MARTGETRGALGLAAGGLLAMAAAVGIGRFIYTPILPRMAEGLGLSQTAAGAIASANFLGYLLGAAAASSALPGSRRAWLLTMLAGSAASTAAMGWADSVPAFAALRFAGGAASAFALVFSSALVLDRLAAMGKGALGTLHFAGVGLGIAVSALLVSALVAGGGDWRALWLAGGAASLLCLLAALALIPDNGEPPRSAASGGRWSPALRAMAAAYGLFGFGYVITATFLVAIVRASPALRSVEPAVWLLVGLAAAPSTALWGAAAKRLGNARAFALAALIEAAGVAASVLWTSVAGVVAAAVLLGGTFMGLTALGLMEGRRLAQGDPRRVLGAMTAVFGVGQIVGPAFAGAAFDRTGSFVLPSIAAAAALLVAAALALLGGVDSRPNG